ncbi:TPA: PTS transporter subunit EIIC [Salmonella enterica subsp. salamae]|nr:PTS transporter subunit EIIC [Salmonella enterica subsp. salamae]
MNYQQVSEDILKHIGGSDNVAKLIHCATRLRFTLKNNNKANVEELKKIDGVMTVVVSSGQTQLVIGNEVGNLFKVLEKKLGGTGSDTVTEAETKEEAQGSLFERAIKIVSGIFIPLIGLIAATGILKGFLTAAVVLNLVSDKNTTWQILSVAADAFFYFLPVILGFSAGKVFNTNPYITATIGAALIHPTMVEFFKDGTSLTFLGIPVILMSYAQSVIPVIIAAKVTAWGEQFLKKVLPVAIQLIFVPLVLFAVVIPATFLIIGPASIYASKGLADLSLALYHLSPVATGFILAGVWQVAVIFGLHWAFIPIFINNISVYGYDPINAMLYCTVFAQTGAALAIALRAKDEKLKTVSYTATLSGFLGITEPAIYGVNLPLRKPFIMASIGSAFGGAIAGYFGAKMFGGFAQGGIFGIPLFIDPAGLSSTFYGFCMSLATAFFVALILTWTLGYQTMNEPNRKASKA